MDTIDKQTDFMSRDDVLFFNDVLSSSGHNIKKYKNRKEEMAKRKKAFTTTTSHEQVHTLTRQPSQKTHDLDNQKMKLYIDKVPIRRISATAGSTRRKQYESLKNNSKNQFFSKTIDFRGGKYIAYKENFQSSKPKEKKQNQFAIIQKRYNKGPLKDKYLETWLNNLLTEACTDQKFDNSVDNPALKSYNLDSNSLLSKGLSQINLNRIYRSLFVYSIGFNDLLNDLCRNNMNLRKTIWKVYSILLEYCAQGHFETMIAQIERDKLKKVDGLKKQIEKRQQIIQNNEQINQKRNAKIYKQIKFLNDQNNELKAQRQILLQEFKQTQQAFNHEVSLRLKYENRINQIHGVYSQIQQKHERLLQDFYKINDQMNTYKAKSQTYKMQIIDQRQQLQRKQKKIEQLQKQLNQNAQNLRETEMIKNTGETTNIAYRNRIKDLQKIISQNTRKMQQDQLNNYNIKLLLQSEQKSHHQTKKELHQRLQQNGRLHTTIQSQMQKISKYMHQDRNLGFMKKQLTAQIHIIKSRLQQKVRQYKQIQKQIDQIKVQKQRTQKDLQAQRKNKQQLQLDLKQCYHKIEEMKTAKNKLQEEYEQKKKNMDIIDEILDEKNSQLSALKQSNTDYMQKNGQLNRQVKTLSSKINTLQQKFASDEQIYQNKIKMLKEQKQGLQNQWNQYENTKKALELQLQRYKTLYTEVNSSFKNEKFQRNNIQLRFQQSLNVMEQENQHIKELNIKISELNEQINSLKRKIKSMEFISQKTEQQHKKQLIFWQKQVNELTSKAGQKKDYIHPMFFQDIAAKLIIVNQNRNKQNQQHVKKCGNLQKSLKQLKEQLKKKQVMHQITQNKKQKQYKLVLDKKTNQLMYEQQRNEHLKQKNNELENQLMIYIQGGKNKLTNEKQQKYLTNIQQKSKQIQELLAEIERIQDANAKLTQNYKDYQRKISQLQKESTTRQSKIQSLNKQVSYKQEIITKISTQLAIIKENQINNEIQQNPVMRKKTESGKNRGSTRQGNRNDIKSYRVQKRQISSDNKRNDFARKYKGAYVYYNK